MKIRKTTEEGLCNHQAQNCVSQKLQLLIVFFTQCIRSLGLTAFESLLVRQLWVNAFTSSCGWWKV
jgi:hypothetical protein